MHACSEFQELKTLQSSLAALAQAEAEACKGLIDAFDAWFAASYASATTSLGGNPTVSAD